MGQAVVEFGKIGAPSRHNGGGDVFDAGGQSEEVTTSGTSAATTMTAKVGDVCVIVNNSDAMIWATFGASPTAAVGTTHAILSKTSRTFGPMGAGFKAALIDDS
jgi:hypothetical protein